MKTLIPHIIHYCWFGKGPKPKSVQKCISSWKKYFPNYEIKEWNEENFDVNLLVFTKEAYAAKKYAFVSDVARFWILYHEGGIYMDTDVEVIASFEDVLKNGAFLGMESASIDGALPTVNPGLGVGAESGNSFMKAMLDYYSTQHYQDEKGVKLPGSIVFHTTKVLASRFSLQPNNEIQLLNDITIYPQDFFCPLDDLTGELKITPNTHSIHWFDKSWDGRPIWYFRLTRVLHRFFGVSFLQKVRSFFRIKNRWK